MNLLPEPQVRSLTEWLAVATRGLTDASKDRIRLEIESHYTQAVEAHSANGESESDAQASALAQLGDAHAAASRFRKRHLTEREEKRLKAADKEGRNIWLLLVNYASFWLFTSGYILEKVFTHLLNPWPYLTLQSVLFIVIPTVCFVVARCSRARPNRHLVWMRALGDLGPSMFFYLMFTSVSHSSLAWNLFASSVVFLPRLPHFLISLHIYMKVGRFGTISTPTPPPTPAQT